MSNPVSKKKTQLPGREMIWCHPIMFSKSFMQARFHSSKVIYLPLSVLFLF
jgi:hypothetical protein